MAKSVYEMVTDRIIDQLKSGIIPWEKPWTGKASGIWCGLSSLRAHFRYLSRLNSCLENGIPKHWNILEPGFFEEFAQ